MQRGATVDAHVLHSFLELVLAGLVVLIMTIIFLLFVAAASPTATLLAGPLSTILALLLVSPFIFSLLLFCKQLNLSAVLEVMALGTVALAVLLVGAP